MNCATVAVILTSTPLAKPPLGPRAISFEMFRLGLIVAVHSALYLLGVSMVSILPSISMQVPYRGGLG